MTILEEETWKFVDKTCSHLDAEGRGKVVEKLLKIMRHTLSAVHADMDK